MPPAAKRDCGLVLFDLCSSGREKLLSGLINFATLKWFSESRDKYSLVLVNSKKTKNENNFPKLFKTNIVDFDPQDIVNNIQNAESEQGDWLDAFLLAICDLKKEADDNSVTTLQLIYFTSLESNNEIDNTKLQKVINQLKETDIFVYIIGPDVKLPCTITHPEDVSHCMRKLIVDKTRPSLVAAQTIVQKTKNSVLCDLNVGINLLMSFKKPRGSQPWKVPMSFGTQLEIPAVSVKLYASNQPLKLASLTSKRMNHVLVEDQTVEVANEDIVKGISRHGKFVKMEGDMFKTDSPRCFEILGFTDMKFVPETHMKGEDVYYVFPNNDNEDDSCDIFYHLVKVLADQNKYAIAKRVYNANCTPKYNVLIPRPDLNPKRFLMVGLPFADELWRHKSEAPKPLKVKQEEDDLRRFLQSIDISGGQCAVDVPLSPLMMLDSYTLRLTREAANKLLDKEFENVNVEGYEMEEENEFLEKLKESWPERMEDENQ